MVERANAWARRRRLELVAKFGGRCFLCGSTEDLEFAHKRPTSLHGRGRGMKERVYDVIRNPFSYLLLCHSCHVWFDR